MNATPFHMTCAALLTTLLLAGCKSQKNEPAPEQPASGEHSHAEPGPHGGHIIELGAEGYHAEVTHEGETVVYFLDGAAKASAAIDAQEVLLNVAHDGQAEQFRLAAKPLPDDPAGKSSQFTSDDAELLADLQSGHAEVHLVATIDGKQYRAALPHDHDHEHEDE